MIRRAVVIALLVFGLVACQGEPRSLNGIGYSGQPLPPTPTARPSGAVSRAQYGTAWPLTVESGTLRCAPGRAVVFRTTDGTDYAVNGTAMDGSYEDIRAIWADDPTGVAPKIDISPLIQAGLKLCR
jgi:hypothetical protein